MKITKFCKIALASASFCLLASCGGGGDEAGAPAAFNVKPDSVTLTGPNSTTCGSGFASQVFVFGGTAPYKLHNSLPGEIFITDVNGTEISQVNNPGDSFYVTWSGGCLDSMPIVVTDALNEQVTFALSSVKGQD